MRYLIEGWRQTGKRCQAICELDTSPDNRCRQPIFSGGKYCYYHQKRKKGLIEHISQYPYSEHIEYEIGGQPLTTDEQAQIGDIGFHIIET